MVAAKKAVAAPIQAMIASVAGARAKRKCSRAVMYTPAVTMVAAWISALTGVGPAMASGNQTNRGICADLPVAPTNRRRVITVIICGLKHPDMFLQLREIQSPDSLAPQFRDQKKNAQYETEIADAVDDEGFVAGDGIVVVAVPEADEQIGAQPTPSQPTKSRSRLSAITRINMKKMNKLR